MSSELTQVPVGEDFVEIRDGVRKVCADYPAEYWREKDEGRGISRRIRRCVGRRRLFGRLDPGGIWRCRPAFAGRIRDPGGNSRRRLQRGRVPRTNVHHGHPAPSRRRGAETQIFAGDRDRAILRLQAFGVSEPTTGTDTTQLKTRARRDGDDYVINGQKIWDQPRFLFRPDAAAGPHHAGGSGGQADRRHLHLHRRHEGRAWQRYGDPKKSQP